MRNDDVQTFPKGSERGAPRCEATGERVRDCGCSLHAGRKRAKGRTEPIKKKRASAQADKRACDKLFSQLIRSRGACERCGKGKNQAQLQCSHIYSRRYVAVRCDPLNALCMCAACHHWWHDRPYDAIEWLWTIRPRHELRTLQQRATQTGVKVDWAAKRAELTDLLRAAA